MKVIIYPSEGGGVSIVSPAPECKMTIEEIAIINVPVGTSYKIVDSETLPPDRTFRDAWEYVE